ncbi:alpha-tocopherol transfer protein-like [Ornithodoros turicata]|uniref:alpha-tocopherol transfer protein-like n=1 Tax=Ornithodoros turicata TaxID=34597 RepID=UPI0031398592
MDIIANGSVECPDLTPEMREKAEEELGETPEKRELCLRRLRSLIKDEEALNSRTDDEFLLRFLRTKKFKVEVAFRTLRNYYRHRKESPEIFDGLRPTKLRVVYEAKCQTRLSHKDPLGRPIFVLRIGRWKPSDYDYYQLRAANMLCLEHLVCDPAVQVNGLVCILDCSGWGLQHLVAFPISQVRKTIDLLQDCLPARFKAVHVVHQPSVFNVFFSLAKPFMTSKHISRIHVHGTNMESLHKHIPPSILPEEYGGTDGPFDNTKFCQGLYDKDDFFIQDFTQYGNKT